MNDLRLLYQIDPQKSIISLQFKQINALDHFMPMLSKFQYLESLSLHGNRLRDLPTNMAALQNLMQLDISNNLFTDIQRVAQSLSTLPQLKHLIMNFKNQQQQKYMLISLPYLEKLNREAIVGNTSEKKSQLDNKNQYQISEQELERVGTLYDDIRQIYSRSNHQVDRELATDFERNVENIMQELSHKLKQSKCEAQSNSYLFSGKYALVDLCFVKMITYFYHFDKNIAKVLEIIHDHQADMFRGITELLDGEIKRKQLQIHQMKVKKQNFYKSQVRRLKGYQEQTNKQMLALESENKQLFNKLYKKAYQYLPNQVFGKSIRTPPSQRSGRSPIKTNNSYHDKQNSQTVVIKSKPKTLTLHQLKDLLYEIYNSKMKANQACRQTFQPLQTMETHMYTYLNLKYGLKSMAIEWAMSVVNGIRKYGLDDPEIGMFGKILRNEIEEKFVEEIKKDKIMINESAKKIKKLTYEQLDPQTDFTLNQCHQIMAYMHIPKGESNAIIDKISRKLTNNLITYQPFEKCLIDYFIETHQKKIKKFLGLFKEADQDEDGVIDLNRYEELMLNINARLNLEAILELVDNSNRGVIVFSPLLEVMLTNPTDFGTLFSGQD